MIKKILRYKLKLLFNFKISNLNEDIYIIKKLLYSDDNVLSASLQRDKISPTLQWGHALAGALEYNVCTSTEG